MAGLGGVGGGAAGRRVGSKTHEWARESAARELQRLEAARREEEARRHEEMVRVTEAWRSEVLPRWSDAKRSGRRVAQLVEAHGVPSQLRHIVWPLLIGNELKVSRHTALRSRWIVCRMYHIHIDAQL
jgi:hypothetical protein